MKTTVFHPRLKKEVSYNTLIKLECYKLVKHFITKKEYEGIDFNLFGETE